eukprot:CAMPEP_0196581842 /NCGR_PEP_ID=MMETSP1081-20130531/35923_1 /TAXON_ID=36882 /ORGANISM="Pyramimonas amylifera, Strain CCMP720" /LENGTH=62 /DNA_ID=CAMNT_0041902219 /DNA_START=73 /DNA_END=261 /DNA_ORIENTATION=+
MARWFYMAMQKEPAVMWACFLGGVGIMLPLVVPPIREALNPPTPVAPPSPTAVAMAMQGKTL